MHSMMWEIKPDTAELQVDCWLSKNFVPVLELCLQKIPRYRIGRPSHRICGLLFFRNASIRCLTLVVYVSPRFRSASEIPNRITDCPTLRLDSSHHIRRLHEKCPTALIHQVHSLHFHVLNATDILSRLISPLA